MKISDEQMEKEAREMWKNVSHSWSHQREEEWFILGYKLGWARELKELKRELKEE